MGVVFGHCSNTGDNSVRDEDISRIDFKASNAHQRKPAGELVTIPPKIVIVAYAAAPNAIGDLTVISQWLFA